MKSGHRSSVVVMATTRSGRRKRDAAHLLGAEWESLTEEERQQALAVARQEGQRAARWYLEERADGSPGVASLRESRWAGEQVELERVGDDLFHQYAAAQTVTCEHHYIDLALERHCPERAEWWWGYEPEERRADPRVCCFCDGYERERCRILGLIAPPRGFADLQSSLWAAKEQEREQGRAWLATSAECGAAAGEVAERHRFVVRWEYQRRILTTDLAEMLLVAATYLHQPHEPKAP